MDNELIKKLYENDLWTLRNIADHLRTDHHVIKRRLLRMGVQITRRKSNRPYVRSPEAVAREKERWRLLRLNGYVSKTKGSKVLDKENGTLLILRNMQTHLKYDVTIEWLEQFPNLDKLRYLNKALSRERDCKGYTSEMYMAYIVKFYHEEKFNRLFQEWQKTHDKWIKPSLDHILPKSKGGALGVDNLQFISWLENRAKSNMTPDEWEVKKANIQYYL